MFWTETASHGLFCRILKVKYSSDSYTNLLDRNDSGICVWSSVLENSHNVFGKEEATFQKGILSYSLCNRPPPPRKDSVYITRSQWPWFKTHWAVCLDRIFGPTEDCNIHCMACIERAWLAIFFSFNLMKSVTAINWRRKRVEGLKSTTHEPHLIRVFQSC